MVRRQCAFREGRATRYQHVSSQNGCSPAYGVGRKSARMLRIFVSSATTLGRSSSNACTPWAEQNQAYLRLKAKCPRAWPGPGHSAVPTHPFWEQGIGKFDNWTWSVGTLEASRDCTLTEQESSLLCISRSSCQITAASITPSPQGMIHRPTEQQKGLWGS